MKKILSFWILLSLINIAAFGQQEVQFSHNMFNNMAINPGFAGHTEAICATAIARTQWMGFTDPQGNKGAPQTFLLAVDGNVNPIRGGLGLVIYQDQLGFEKNLGVKLGYAYQMKIGHGKLGIGAQVGFLNKTIDFSKFIYIDPVDQLLQDKGKPSDMLTDYSAGVFYSVKDKFYAGISSSQLSEAQSSFGAQLASPKLRRHYYLSAGYQIPLSSQSFEFDPSILVKSDASSYQFDINALLWYNDKFWAGLSYRYVDAVVVLIGLKPIPNNNDFKLGISYDITTSALGAKKRSNGTIEVMLNYCFKVEVPKNREGNGETKHLR
jgi:type IX secretion system PorP/SprF family membrane protein